MNDSSLRTDLDCAVCLQKCNHPTQLPCGHVFCFLCVKGIAFQSKKCAMCRAAIPSNYLDNPIILGKLPAEQVNTSHAQEGYQWFYEGRNGWWKYDERSNSELETSFNASDPDCTLLLAGTLYIIDFQSMTQVRRSDHTRRRRVRRDTPMFPAKGIAGIKADNAQNTSQIKSEQISADVIFVETDNEIIEISDNDDVEIVDSALQHHHDDVALLVERISEVDLREVVNPEDLEHENT